MNRPLTIDLNADVGEGCGFDAGLVPLVSSVNIACGAHAGDEAAMREAVLLSMRHGVAIGAHPGFADREHFGRREIAMEPDEAAILVVAQARRLRSLAQAIGASVGHVKLHGALYNMAARDPRLAGAVASALDEDARSSGHAWTLVALAGSALEAAGRNRGLRVVAEAFADRAYARDGTLSPRSAHGAVIVDVRQAARQALSIAREGTVVAGGGEVVAVKADTICIHGDNPQAPLFARAIRGELEAAGITVRSPSFD
jgi:UPF0271 protein